MSGQQDGGRGERFWYRIFDPLVHRLREESLYMAGIPL